MDQVKGGNEMKEKFIVFLIILGIILGLIHLNIMGIWIGVPG